MFGSVVQWMMSSLGGIKITDTSVAFDHFIIAPRPVIGIEYGIRLPPLLISSYITSSYNSIRGTINCSWTLDATTGAFSMDIVVPFNTWVTAY